MKRIVIATTILTACFAFADPFAKCVACHGANGEKAALGKSVIIKDLSKADFVAAIKGYQAGTFGGAQKALMVPQAKGLTDADLDEIAAKLQLK